MEGLGTRLPCGVVTNMYVHSTWPNLQSILTLSFRDINACDKDGRSALHFVSSSESVHARKMVSVLLRSGSDVGESVA